MSDPDDLLPTDLLTVGTVGPPGQRTFLLQGRRGAQVVTLKVEKAQVAALSQYLGRLLADLPEPGQLPEDLELVEPQEPAFTVGSLGVSYDEDDDRILLVADEATEEEAEEGATARFGITREQAAALAIRGVQLVQAGRPPCPLCGLPLDPRGHACPRTNGHRPPRL
ncbi:MAG: DUF3090 family protein [Acidimicrobiales bacterium]|nr:DUF3090 family protein [Acidimicrobiales bacterium]MBO0886287.1 DUF3090 family protein [Acidimicrobiales bacterium]